MNTYFSFINTEMLEKKLASVKFPFSKYLFWDTSPDMIDIQKHRKYIIERVLSKGFLSDFYLLINIYSNEEIISAIKSSRSLDKKTVNFCSNYFNVPLNELYASPYYS